MTGFQFGYKAMKLPAKFIAAILLVASPGVCEMVTLDLSIFVTSKMVNAPDQSLYPYTPDPLFAPFQMQAQVIFDDSLVSTQVLPNRASINFGPELTLSSPLTSTLHYGPDDPIGYPTVQSFDNSAYYGAWDKGTFLDFGQISSVALSPTDRAVYNWGLLSPTTDPRYPPLVDPSAFGTSELMTFLQVLQQTNTPLNYTEISSEMINSTSPLAYYGTYYPYTEWYSGTATVTAIETAVPEPDAALLTGIGLAAILLVRPRFGVIKRHKTITK